MTTDAPAPLKVALLGTGTMGAGMARNILGAGLDLTVWNRSTDKASPLADAGATVATDPAAAVSGADVVLTMLYDAASVIEVMERTRGHLAPGAVWVQTSTIGVTNTDDLAELAADLGLLFLDTPVLGTKQPAEQGALTVLASGDEALGHRVAPVLEAIGARTIWAGDVGAGTRLKLACNAWVFTVVTGTAQSLALAEALGLDGRTFLEAIAGGPLDAPYVQLKGSAMLDGSWDPAFALDVALKDADLIVEAAASSGVSTDVVAAIRDRFRAASRAGHGERDMSAVYLALR